VNRRTADGDARNEKGRGFQQDPPWYGTEETGQDSTKNQHPESQTRQFNRTDQPSSSIRIENPQRNDQRKPAM
jgi:hypothetical protein